MNTETIIEPARQSDYEAMLALMPRLAEFELPPHRKPRDLWRHDADLLQRWKDGKADNCMIFVARQTEMTVLGLAMTTLKPEMLSGKPSAHLEALAVARDAQGQGIAAALIEATQKAALKAGAESLTLNVFGVNKRARAVYARAGFNEELIRCSKPLG